MQKYTIDTALTEATRCLGCHDAPCHTGCPAGVNPKSFIRKIRFGDLENAARLLREANIMAGSCARLCPCHETCCQACTNEKLTHPIDIAGLQNYVMQWAREHARYEVAPVTPNGKKVAVIGSGPAGLSCSARLSASGYEVHVFEKYGVLGGQLRLSIPAFRLPTEILDADVDFIKKLGVHFHLNSEIKDIAKLKAEGFQAVFASVGLMGSRKLGIDGENKKGVYDALDFLIRARNGERVPLGKKVLVIGGGNTAIDSARVAKKMGAEVVLVYRRTQGEMPAYRTELDEAFSEGVEFLFRIVPLAVVGNEDVEGLKVIRVKWKGVGRKNTEYDIEGSEFVLSVDAIINAVGQEREFVGLKDVGKVSVQNMMVEDGVFVGGDFAFGGGTAVSAVGTGSKAAGQIVKYLGECRIAGSQDRRSVGVGVLDDQATLRPCDPVILTCAYYAKPKVDLSVTFCGVKFENPFVLAAAPPTDELEMLRNGLKAGWAGAVLKTTSIEGTPVPLKYPMMSGLDFDGQKLNSMGNIDLISEHHIDVVEKRIRALKAEFPNKVIIGSMMGSKKEEWQHLVKRLSDAGADMIECSFSCPQGSLGAKPGQMLAQDVTLTKTVAGWVKEAAKAHPRNLPVVIKITPHVTDICDVAQAVKESGADAVCASNTIQSLMGIDLNTWIPHPNVAGKSTYSGMSGPAIKPITLKVISEIARKVGIPITGTGGPVNWADAVEFMLCGAGLVQFCTAVMHFGYDIIDDLKEGMATYLANKGLQNVSHIIGRSLPFITSHEELCYEKKIKSVINDILCVRCGDCVIACQDGGHMAITADIERKPVVDNDKCVGCGLCRLVCPVRGCVEINSCR